MPQECNSIKTAQHATSSETLLPSFAGLDFVAVSGQSLSPAVEAREPNKQLTCSYEQCLSVCLVAKVFTFYTLVLVWILVRWQKEVLI